MLQFYNLYLRSFVLLFQFLFHLTSTRLPL